jgi:hypothetical protein
MAECLFAKPGALPMKLITRGHPALSGAFVLDAPARTTGPSEKHSFPGYGAGYLRLLS